MIQAKSVEEYLAKSEGWEESLKILRDLMLETELIENIKWGAPVYSIGKKNVVGLGAFKAYVGLWFYQGVFLNDDHNKLVNAQEGKTKAMRQWRFQSADEIREHMQLIRTYVAEAIANQKAGKEIKPQRKPLIIPEELQHLLDTNPDISACFASMSLSHKREYADYISEAKRAETRLRRLEKIKPMILDGISMNDKYRK